MAQTIHTFTVENVDEIIPKIRQDFGDDAMLVTHKQIKPKTLTQKPLYEVVVAVDEQLYQSHLKKMGKTPLAKNSQTKEKKELAEQDEAVVLDFSKSSQEIKQTPQKATQQRASVKEAAASLEHFKERLFQVGSEISKITDIQAQTPVELPDYDERFKFFEKEISKLSQKVSLVVDMIWEDKAYLRKDLVIPPEFASIYKKAKNSGMKEEHLEAIMRATIENMPTSMKANPDAVLRYFYSLLRNMLPVRAEKEIKKQKIMMLVGPTGVGKTTTLAKLAFRYAYGDKRYKTGIITLDTYRIGAVEQLFQYAKMMKLPIIDSIEPKDLNEAIRSLNQCEVILVDTIGNSQYDQSKLAKTKEFLTQSNADIDVNLVISSNTKFEDLFEIYNNFSQLNIDTLIITKFDESKAFGNIFSLIYETNIPMSFFSTGQEVPDDIELANGEFLVNCILEGFKKGKNNE